MAIERYAAAPLPLSRQKRGMGEGGAGRRASPVPLPTGRDPAGDTWPDLGRR